MQINVRKSHARTRRGTFRGFEANLKMKKFARIYILVGNENITASHTFHYVNRCYFAIIFEYVSRNF